MRVKATVMTYPIDSIRVGSVRTFLDALETISNKESHELFYRGHSSFNYDLIPSIYRNNKWIQNEDILHKEIILKCPNDFINHENTFQFLRLKYVIMIVIQ